VRLYSSFRNKLRSNAVLGDNGSTLVAASSPQAAFQSAYSDIKSFDAGGSEFSGCWTHDFDRSSPHNAPASDHADL
jgi:hypothetical protein